MATFETFGYSKDYYVDGKYKGSLVCDEEPGRDFGYNGRKKEILADKITFKNKTSIKAGTEVTTEIFPLNGRVDKHFQMQPNEKAE